MILSKKQEQIYEINLKNVKNTKDSINEGKILAEKLQKKYPNVLQKFREDFPDMFKKMEQSYNKDIGVYQIFDIFLPLNQKIQNEKFLFINSTSSKQIFEELDRRQEEYSNGKIEIPLFKILLPQIMNRLISSEEFDKIFDHNIFAKYHKSSLFKFSVRGFLIFIIQRLGNASKRLINLYSKIPRVPIPLIYQLNNNENTICLKQISTLLMNPCLNVLSIGSQNCGKSTLLNQIFHTKFEMNSNNILHKGVDIVFHTSQFEQKFNLFDFQGDAMQNKQILKLLTFMTPHLYIIIQISDLVKCKEILEYLKQQCKVELDRLIIISRDVAEGRDGFFIDELSMLGVEEQIDIPKCLLEINCINPASVVYRNNLSSLQKSIHEVIWKQVNDILKQKTTCNFYWNYQNKLYQYYQTMMQKHRSKKQNIGSINAHLTNFQDPISLPSFCQHKKNEDYKQLQNFSNVISQSLKQIKQKSIRSTLFPFLNNRHQLDRITSELNKIYGAKMFKQEQEWIQKRLKVFQNFNHCKIHKLVQIYHSLICNKEVQKRMQFQALLTSWQSPLLSPQVQKLSALKTCLKQQKQKIEDNQRLLQQFYSNQQNKQKDKQRDKQKDKYIRSENDKGQQFLKQTQITKIKKSINDLQERIKFQIDKIQQISVNRQHFWRQIIFLYQHKDLLKDTFAKYNWLDQQRFIEGCCYYIRNGGQFQLLDGDNNDINEHHLEKIFSKIHPEPEQKKQLFVISIIGPQSTGKSTLLNFLLKTAFQMSAGRCTNGLYASLLQTDFPKAKDCLVLDSEGLLSIERSDEHFDRMLTIFAMSLSNIMIINVNGQMSEAMKKILEISLYAANQLRLNMDKRPIIFFVLRNMIDEDKVKQSQMIKKLGQQFQKIASISKVNVKNIIDYRDQKSFQLMFSAYNKDKEQILGRNDNLTICVVNNSFRIKCAQLRNKIFQQARQSTSIPYTNLNYFQKTLKYVWTCLKQNSDLTQYQNVKQLQDNIDLSKKVVEHIQIYIQSNISDQQSMAKQIDNLIRKMMQQNKDFLTIKIEINKIAQRWENKLISKFQQISKDYKFQLQFTFKKEIKRKLQTLCHMKIQEANQKFKSQQSKIIVRNVNISQIMNKLKTNFQESKQQISIEKKIQKYKKYFNTMYDSQCNSIQMQFQQLRNKNNYIQMLFQVNQLLQGQRKLRHQQNIILMNKIILDSWVKLTNNYQKIIPFQEKHQFIRNQQKLCINFYQQYIKKLQYGYSLIKYGNSTAPKYQSILGKFFNDLKSIFNKNQFNFQIQQQKITQTSKQKINLSDVIFKSRLKFSQKNYEKLKTIINRIFRQQKYFQDINSYCIRMILPQIQNEIKQIDKQLQNKTIIYLERQIIKVWITDYLMKHLTQKKIQILKLRHQKQLNNFKNDKARYQQAFVIKICSTLGDVQSAKNHSKQLINIITDLIKEKLTANFLEKIKKSSISSQALMQKVDQYALQIKNTKDKSLLLQYATQIDSFCSFVLQNQFQKISNRQKINILDKQSIFRQQFQLKTKNILQRMEKLIQVFQQLIQSKEINILDQKIKQASSNRDAEIELNQITSKICEIVVKYLFAQNIQQQYKFISQKDIMKKHKIFFSNLQINAEQIKIYNIFKTKVLKDKIKNAKIYSKQLFQSFKLQLKSLKFKPIQKPDTVNLCKRMIFVKALGCTEKCPYCGIKCKLQANHMGKHQSIRHRMMGLNRSYEQEDNVLTLLSDYCNSQNNFHKSRWVTKQIKQTREVKNRQISQVIKQRLKQNQANSSKFNFTVIWDNDLNPTDLDLHVVCPCGTQICFYRKNCNSCGGYLDVDHTYRPKPIEHVYFQNPKIGQYKAFVHYYGDLETQKIVEKQCTLTVHKYDNDINHLTFSLKKKQYSQSISYQPQNGITFSEHLQTNFNKWSINQIKKQHSLKFIKYEENDRQILKMLENQLISKLKNG